MTVRKRWLTTLVAGAGLTAAVLIRAQSAGPAIAATAGATSNDASCSIATMADEYGFTVESKGEAPLAAVLDKVVAEVQRVEPGAVVAEQTSGPLLSSRLPTIDGRAALVLRLDGLAPRSAGGPQPAEGEGSDGVTRPPLNVTCAVALFDSTTGDFLVSMIDMVAPEK